MYLGKLKNLWKRYRKAPPPDVSSVGPEAANVLEAHFLAPRGPDGRPVA